MTWRRRTVLVALSVITLALTSCSGHGTASAPPNGIVVGRLGAEGGVVSTGLRPFSTGTVTLARSHVPYSMRVTVTGSFRFSVPPGEYQVTGVSSRYGNGTATCRGGTVRVKSDITVSVNVVCQER